MVSDVGGGLTNLGDLVFPMLRSNAVNLHPIAAAIYHGMFYHHGAGSRDFSFRATKRFANYRHDPPNIPECDIGEALTQELIRDPQHFVDRLTSYGLLTGKEWDAQMAARDRAMAERDAKIESLQMELRTVREQLANLPL
jgi:hypothetical protein